MSTTDNDKKKRANNFTDITGSREGDKKRRLGSIGAGLHNAESLTSGGSKRASPPFSVPKLERKDKSIKKSKPVQSGKPVYEDLEKGKRQQIEDCQYISCLFTVRRVSGWLTLSYAVF